MRGKTRNRADFVCAYAGRFAAVAAIFRSQNQLLHECVVVALGPAIVSVVLLRRIRAKADRKSTRLNSSHGYISYAVFCLKKKKNRPRDGGSHSPSLHVLQQLT